MIGSIWIPVDSPVGYHGTDREDERWLADLPVSISGDVRVDLDLAGVFLSSTPDLPYEFRLRLGGNPRAADGEQLLLLTGTGVTQAQIDAGAAGIGQAHASMDLLPVTTPLILKLTAKSAEHGQMIRIRGGSVRVQFSPAEERVMGESTSKGTDIWFDIVNPELLPTNRIRQPAVGLADVSAWDDTFTQVSGTSKWQGDAQAPLYYKVTGDAREILPGERFWFGEEGAAAGDQPHIGLYEMVERGVTGVSYPVVRRTSDANTPAGLCHGMVTFIPTGGVEYGGSYFVITTADPITPDTTALAVEVVDSAPVADYTPSATSPSYTAGGEPNTLVTVSGDWTLVEGEEAVVQSLTRRYLTGPGEWKTKPGYGAGLRDAARRRARGADIDELTNRMRQQNALEKRISPKSEVSVYPLSGTVNGLGFKVTIIFADDVNATPRTFTGVVPA